jgi:tungstate transport system substrate-binding protein
MGPSRKVSGTKSSTDAGEQHEPLMRRRAEVRRARRATTCVRGSGVRRASKALLGALLLILLTACSGPEPRERLLLVTTHSVEDSGLLEALADAFHEARPDIRLMVTAVGSGAALEMGRRGDADVLLTHDPDGERRLLEEGHITDQGPVMANRYVIVGPPSDPVGLAGGTDAVAALRSVAEGGGRFLSRGDDSGTHRKERQLWGAAGLSPWVDRPAWYIEAGLGMAETLHTGAQLGAYLITDESTFLHLADRLGLAPMVRSDPLLANPYAFSVPTHPRNPEAARAFVAWLTGPGQRIIAAYGVERFGDSLFRPATPPTGTAEPWN